MKKSIRRQYTLIFAAVIIVILFAIWCMNNLFLEWFYIRNKEGILKHSYLQIEEMLKTGQMKLASDGSDPDMETPDAVFLRDMMEKYNISILLMDTQTEQYLSTEPRNGRSMEMRMMELYRAQPLEEPEGDGTDTLRHPGKGNAPAPPLEAVEVLEETEDYVIQKIYNNRFKSAYLQSYGYFPDTNISFLMSLPLASIQESVELSNRFLTFLSLIGLLLGSVVIFVTTKKVAEPIMTLSRLSEEMSDLNFNVKYTGTGENEISVLGNSMNVLSDRLKETMGELKSANIKLQTDIEQKIKIDEMRKDFISNVSHELKTPLTIIHGYAEGLAEGMCRDEESRSFYYQVILSETDKMTVLVKQLLNLSDLEFGFDLPQIERFDLTELIKDVLNSQKVLLKDKGAEVEFLQTEPVYVWADEFKIEEVLNNYLSNALNHLEGEGRIRLAVEKQDSIVKTSVFNTGRQIPEEALEQLWTKFYKVDKARTREYGGSGIGLSIVKAIMDSHHRECGAENREDGVEFYFTLDGETAEKDGERIISENDV